MPTPDTRDIRALIIGGVLIMAVGGYFISRTIFFSENNANIPATQKQKMSQNVPLVSPDVLSQKIHQGENIRLIDARSPESFEREHLPKSISAPLSTLAALPEDEKTLSVIILSGDDDQALEVATNILENTSISYVFLKGGFSAWKESGYPTVSVGDPNSFLDQSKVSYISPDDLKKIFQENPSAISLLDVQEPEQYATRHIKGAINIPLKQLEKRIGEVSSGKIIVVYGENELASFQGGVRLFDLNIFTARTLTGNNNLSLVSGFPLE